MDSSRLGLNKHQTALSDFSFTEGGCDTDYSDIISLNQISQM